MRPLRTLSLSLPLATLLYASTAGAQQTVSGFALDRYEPSERGSEWFMTDSLDLRGEARPAFGAVFDYGYQPQRLRTLASNDPVNVVDHQAFLHVGGAFVLADRVRLAASIPVLLSESGTPTVWRGDLYSMSGKNPVGDLRLAVDARIAGEYGDPITAAFGVRFWAPTGSQSRYTSDGNPRFSPHLSIAGDIGPFVYALTGGFMVRKHDQLFAYEPIGSELFFGASAGVHLLDKHLIIGPEIWESATVTNLNARPDTGVFKNGTTAIEGILGAHYTAGPIRIGLAGGPGFYRAPGTARFRGLASLEWVPEYEAPKKAPPPPPPDRDHDGVFDADDACPDVAGKHTNDPKTNGCPDKDDDRIPDQLDACPSDPGVPDPDPKKNGCPPDHDGDGVADLDDACPAIPGVKTTDPQTNGCPPDKDKDSIPDDKDACPDLAGPANADPAKNGCPDKDADGIIDPQDACPDVAGPANADPKKNGCPLVYVTESEIKITEQIHFQTGSAVILQDSATLVKAVADIMKAHPEIKKIRIEGHTDNKGSAALNKGLSKNRAAAVVAALVKQGVASQRMVSEGFGDTRPIADNSTDEGRALNRRVEFHIVDPKPKDKEPEAKP